MSVHVNDGTQGGITGLGMAMLVKIHFLLPEVTIDNNELIVTIILAAVGAVVGFFAHITCKYLWGKLKKLFKREKK